MYRLIALALLMLTTSPAYTNTIVDAQKILNQLGFSAGRVDGQYGAKTQAALEDFYLSIGSKFDGTLNENELSDLYQAAGIERKATSELAGVFLESELPFKYYPPDKPGITKNKYNMDPLWTSYDLNNDGELDFIFTGAMIPTNLNIQGDTQDESCGRNWCEGQMPGPTVFLRSKTGYYSDISEKFLDRRDPPGQSLGRQTLVADFNNDGVKDIYIADTAAGTVRGIRDSYFLSQPNHTWLESSETHLSSANLITYNHGAATGDIDGDGDFDIVLATLNKGLYCWINNGIGQMRHKKCGTGRMSAIELADIDGDGDLDIVYGGDEADKDWANSGVMSNNGVGRFRNYIEFEPRTIYTHIPDVSVRDLDQDGDLDVILSRVGYLYVGTAVEILRNEGNFQFTSKFYELGPAPSDYVPKHEGNEWNSYVRDFKFADVNGDGLDDIILIGGGHLSAVHYDNIRGAVLLNSPNMLFDMHPISSEKNPIQKISKNQFEFKASELLSLSSQSLSFGGSKKTKYYKRFDKFMVGKTIYHSSSNGYEKLEKPIQLSKSGISIVGAKNVRASDLKVKYDVLLEWGEYVLESSICTEYYEQHSFTATRLAFDAENGFGGVQELRELGTHNCSSEIGYLGEWEFEDKNDDSGILSVLADLNQNGRRIIAALPNMSDEKKMNFLKRTE